MKKRLALGCLLAAVGTGCATIKAPEGESAAFQNPAGSSRPSAPASGPQTTARDSTAAPLPFIDSNLFDDDLSTHLEQHPPEMVVATHGGITVNQLPPRLDRWLGAVKDSGGSVRAYDLDNPSRGLFGVVLDIAFAVAGQASATRLYRSAAQYDVLIDYHAGDGRIERLRFVPRGSR